VSNGADSGMAAIAARFGVGLAVGAGADDAAADAAGMPVRRPKAPVFPFAPNPGVLTGTAVGSFVQLDLFTPQSGWFADITSMTMTGFTAGTIAVTRGGPAVTAAGNPVAIEYVAQFTGAQAGVPQAFPQKGNPLLDANDNLYFTVTSALTGGPVIISGTAIMVPVSRIDDYLS